MKKQPLDIEKRIFTKIKRADRGRLFFAENFKKIGNVKAINKALERLSKKGEISRVAQGIYVMPVIDPVIGNVLPSLSEISIAIARRDKARIVPTGVQALNLLGLSTQVPLNIVYLTDGASRKIQVGKQKITFKRTTPKNLLAKGEISGLVIQALRAIGKGKVSEAEKKKISAHLKNEEMSNLIHDINLAPAWIAEIMKLNMNIIK